MAVPALLSNGTCVGPYVPICVSLQWFAVPEAAPLSANTPFWDALSTRLNTSTAALVCQLTSVRLRERSLLKLHSRSLSLSCCTRVKEVTFIFQ